MKDQWELKTTLNTRIILKMNFKAFFTEVDRFSLIWTERILCQPKTFNVTQRGLSFLSPQLQNC